MITPFTVEKHNCSFVLKTEIKRIVEGLNDFKYQRVSEELLYQINAYLITEIQYIVSLGLYWHEVQIDLIKMKFYHTTCCCPANFYTENILSGNDESLEDLVNS